MREPGRPWIGLGALAGLGTVALAAAAAHLPLDDHQARMLREAVQMQGWHALALLACGLWRPRGGRAVDVAGAAFAVGLLLFCGAIDALVFAHRSLGLVAPTGGILLMGGWLALAVSALSPRHLSS